MSWCTWLARMAPQAGAIEGTLSIMVGGARGQWENARPILEAILATWR